MDVISRNPIPVSAQPQWRTEDFLGKQIHVCAKQRPPQKSDSSGDEFAWAYTVRVTEHTLRLLPSKSSSASSEPGLLYLTQAIAEEMGFAKGRKLIEGG